MGVLGDDVRKILREHVEQVAARPVTIVGSLGLVVAEQGTRYGKAGGSAGGLDRLFATAQATRLNTSPRRAERRCEPE